MTTWAGQCLTSEAADRRHRPATSPSHVVRDWRRRRRRRQRGGGCWPRRRSDVARVDADSSSRSSVASRAALTTSQHAQGARTKHVATDDRFNSDVDGTETLYGQHR